MERNERFYKGHLGLKLKEVIVKDKDLVVGLVGGVAAGLLVVLADDLVYFIFGDKLSILSLIFKLLATFVLLILVLFLFLVKTKLKKK